VLARTHARQPCTTTQQQACGDRGVAVHMHKRRPEVAARVGRHGGDRTTRVAGGVRPAGVDRYRAVRHCPRVVVVFRVRDLPRTACNVGVASCWSSLLICYIIYIFHYPCSRDRGSLFYGVSSVHFLQEFGL